MPRHPKQYKNGDTFNNLTIIEEAERKITPNGSIKRCFKCKCVCGKIKNFDLQTLKKINSCGCLPKKYEKIMQPEIGNKYGRLTIIEEMDKKYNQRRVKSICDCGNVVISALCSLKTKKGGTKSCGCLQKEKTKEHALKKYPNPIKNNIEYHIWRRMINLTHINRSYYGNGKTTMDCMWKKNIENFISDMGKKPTPEHILMRISKNPKFEKNNCKWVTQKERGEILKKMNVKYNKEKFPL